MTGDTRFVAPRYRERALSDLLPSVAGAMGVADYGNLLGLPSSRRYVVVMVDGLVTNGSSFDGAITPDGRYAVFTSGARNLVGNDTNQAEYMPHPNVGGFHVQPGVELLWTRDLGVHLFLDLQHWLIYNAPDNNAVVLGVGLVFFT